MLRVQAQVLILAALIFSSVLPAAKKERKLYVGKNSTEARLTFEFAVELKSKEVPSKKEQEETVENQVLHLYGPLSFAEISAVPKGDHHIKITAEPALKADTKNIWVIPYQYEGTIALENGPNSEYEVILPFNPDTIYEASGLVRKLNPCTDEHYNDESDFWYFWNPYQEKCKLKKDVDFKHVAAKIERYENTTQTYPEYERLFRDTSDGKWILINAFLGMDEPDKFSWNPLRSRDVNATNYREMRQSLFKMGFRVSRPYAPREISRLTGLRVRRAPFMEDFTKMTPEGNILVRMYFGATGMDEESEVFHWLYANALTNSSVVLYDGHSGLGDHLDLEDIEKEHGYKIRLGNDYQIYYFNSCTSYSYYNNQYFARKKSESDLRGTKNLDILTNGLATEFSVMHDTNLAVVKAIVNWAEHRGSTSYKKIAEEIDSDNLFGVNGDEDNPINP